MKRSLSKTKIQKWIKEGRGKGHGKEYKPWLTVRDFTSGGKVHRVFGHKTRRTHQLSSNLELAVFLISEWHSETVDIREHFPLGISDTCALAEKAQIKHPVAGGTFQIQTSDFLIDTINSSFPKIALQAIYSKSLQSPKTVEKIEIENLYWKSKNIPWWIVTEQEVPSVAFRNIEWLYPAQRVELSACEIEDRVQFYVYQFHENPDYTIINLCKKLDVSYDMLNGESLREIRELIAQGYFSFDMHIPVRQLKITDLKAADVGIVKEAWRVSSQ
ncbi:TnsA endonuclease C-terminal domain-containing protein [Desulforhopalus sp. 52FAK]